MRVKARSFFPWLVLIAGLAATALVTYAARRAEASRSSLHFKSAVDKTDQSIDTSVRHYITLLRAGGLFFSANRWTDSAAQLKAYASEVELQQSYQGVKSMGLCLRFTPDEKKRLDQDKTPGRVRIWPDSPRLDYFSIVAIEPLDNPNRSVLGFDMFTEPTRRAAMLQACDSGAPTATARVRLLGDTNQDQAGFIIFSPLYQSGRVPATQPQRRQELRGFTFCAFRVGDLISSAVDSNALLPLGLQIYDGTNTTPKHLLFSSVASRVDSPRFQIRRSLDLAGRSWNLVFSSRPEFESTSMRAFIDLIPILGILFSGMLFIYLRFEASARIFAETQSAELERSESLLRQTAQRNRILVDNVPVIIWESDPDGRCVFVNQTGIQLCGRPIEKLRGARWQALLHDEDRTRFLFAVQSALSSQTEFSIKVRLKAYTGQYRWLWFTASPLLGPDNRLMGYLGSCIDITEQETVQEWLRASEELYRIIADTSGQGVLTMDQKGSILTVNELTTAIFGWHYSDLVGKNLSELIPDLTQNQHFQEFLEKPQSTPACKDIPLPAKHQDGSELSIELSLGFALKQGTPFIIAVIRDVSQHKRVQQAMFHVQKMQAIGSLASGIAHDFNNVFTAILSHLDLAIHSEGDPAQSHEHLDYVRTSVSRGAELVKRLLSFSRHSVPQSRLLNPADLVKDTVALLQRSITRRIQITSEIHPSLWMLKGDDSQIKQVIVNLCLNARDAMPEAGDMGITVSNQSFTASDAVTPRHAGDFVRITVSDTGAGMSKQVMDRLFEPYFTTKEFGKGAGLGLSICNNIVLEHGGWIEVESKLGHGSRFHVFLPRCESANDPSSLVLPAAPKPKSNFEGTETVLVADDDYMIRNLVRAVLAYRGYKVIEAVDGEEALEKALSAEDPVDLILLDVEMPKLDGWTVLKKTHEQRPAVPIILCTGADSSAETEQDAKAAGATRVLGKPFTNPELLKLVRDTLDSAKNTAKTNSD